MRARPLPATSSSRTGSSIHPELAPPLCYEECSTQQAVFNRRQLRTVLLLLLRNESFAVGLTQLLCVAPPRLRHCSRNKQILIVGLLDLDEARRLKHRLVLSPRALAWLILALVDQP